MNRREFEEHLRSHGCQLHRHGSKHDLWLNPSNGAKSPVPRHRTLKKPLIRGIC
ncbi:type II toxin-antitoxin system HicA family toxin [Zavarzinella formosa]|uniref:type II toxin-antitoxin system HicA family toxin n=1 Tax=Zavarzinella formosa TaxID=360055 RepID=UPI0002E7A3C6